MNFYLGTHCDGWLSEAGVPLFVSARRLRRRKRLPRAIDRWALDSGGFTELSMYGKWLTTPAQYAREARRWSDHIGGLDWAATQDWMCEPMIIGKTGLSVSCHQQRSLQSYLELSALAPDILWMPVVQGWTVADYLRHCDMYAKAGVDLRSLPIVGIGSVCRRQATAELKQIIGAVRERARNLHAFGVKMAGVAACADMLASADSMAWSYNARSEPPMPGCSHGSTGLGNCANCIHYALAWREKILAAAVRSRAEMGIY